jgi:hypothetical protein
MQQTIPPSDQMWVNLASLIRDRIPDRKGNVLPADLTFGTYDVQQINSAPHSLALASLAVDQTWGYQIAPPYATCCSYGSMGWVPDSIVLDPEGIAVTDIDATDSCNGSVTNLSSDFGIWSSGNTSVAVVTRQKVQAVGVGTTTGTAQGGVFEGVGGYCAFVPEQPKAPITVFDVGAAGKSYIFVGSDPNELYGNRYTVLNSALNGAPQPPGGTCCAYSGDPSDGVTSVTPRSLRATRSTRRRLVLLATR